MRSSDPTERLEQVEGGVVPRAYDAGEQRTHDGGEGGAAGDSTEVSGPSGAGAELLHSQVRRWTDRLQLPDGAAVVPFPSGVEHELVGVSLGSRHVNVHPDRYHGLDEVGSLPRGIRGEGGAEREPHNERLAAEPEGQQF